MQPLRDPRKRTGYKIMAKDSEGRKFNRIPAYDRVLDGKVIHVPAHIRTNRSDCKGQKK
jgi:hypothetical protein